MRTCGPWHHRMKGKVEKGGALYQCFFDSRQYLEVSWNPGAPKFSILIRFSIMNHPAIGVPPWPWKPPFVAESLWQENWPRGMWKPQQLWMGMLKKLADRLKNFTWNCTEPCLHLIIQGPIHHDSIAHRCACSWIEVLPDRQKWSPTPKLAGVGPAVERCRSSQEKKVLEIRVNLCKRSF